MQHEGEPDIDRIAQWVQNLFKFKHYYDQMDFSPKQRLAISKSIIQLTDPSGSYGFVENRPRKVAGLKIARLYSTTMTDATFQAATTVLYMLPRV